jgi:hypothetical protein
MNCYQDAQISFSTADEHKIPIEKAANQKKNNCAKQICEEDGAHDHCGALATDKLKPR